MTMIVRLASLVGALLAPLAATVQPVDLLTPPADPSTIMPVPLAPLDTDDPWSDRLTQAGLALFAALDSGDPVRWVPLMGGDWLAPAERARIAAWQAAPGGAFQTGHGRGWQYRLLGWQAGERLTAQQRRDWAARQQAEAIFCRAPADGPASIWPQMAAQAMRGSTTTGGEYVCVRLTYALDGETARWRGYLD